MDMKMMNKYSSISYSLVSYSFGVVLGVASPLQLLVMTVGTNNNDIVNHHNHNHFDPIDQV